jgi:hypothetical protein
MQTAVIVRTIEPNDMFRHYKGATYYVCNLSEHTETNELFVNYYDITKPEKIWSRPLTMFNEYILIDGCLKLRFEEIQK